MRVLIVDDEPDILTLIKFALEVEDDIDATYESSGVLASERIRFEEFDLYVLDWMMPPPDGRQLLSQIRSIPRLLSKPVLICTARTGKGAIDEITEAGASRVIEKPFSPLTLAETLRCFGPT